jgi:hypothetical protein
VSVLLRTKALEDLGVESMADRVKNRIRDEFYLPYFWCIFYCCLWRDFDGGRGLLL